MKELKQVMEELGHSLAQEQIDSIMKSIKIDSTTPNINYTEFLAATIDKKQLLTKERLWNAFKHFDVDDTNQITPENIKEVMNRVGRKISDEEIIKMIQEVDLTGEGNLSFEGFKSIMDLDEPVQMRVS